MDKRTYEMREDLLKKRTRKKVNQDHVFTETKIGVLFYDFVFIKTCRLRKPKGKALLNEVQIIGKVRASL